jgi:hypothetical protein
VIPDLRGHVNRAVQVLEPFAPEKLELKRLTHRRKNSVHMNMYQYKSNAHIHTPDSSHG